MCQHNCITSWYPHLVRSGVKTPKTSVVLAPNLISLFDNVIPEGYYKFKEDLEFVIKDMGLPCFLRTGHTSGKHGWKDTCYVDDLKKLDNNIFNLLEACELASAMGLPHNVWAVRELLPTTPIFRAFHGMPITKEARLFFKDGAVVGWQPYWPPEVFNKYEPDIEDWEPRIKQMNYELEDDIIELKSLTEKVIPFFNGYWSIDWLLTTNGWYCIDMALGVVSYKWNRITGVSGEYASMKGERTNGSHQEVKRDS